MASTASEMKHLLTIMAAMLSGCVQQSECSDNPLTPEPCDGSICFAQPTIDSAGDEVGVDEEAVCTPYEIPTYDGQSMSCGGIVSEGEHMTDSACWTYGVTDYELSNANVSLAVLYDFMPIPAGEEETWFDAWNWLTALPGVATHEQQGVTFAAFMSRGCCAQTVLEGTLGFSSPPNAACSGGGDAVNLTPNAWCLSIEGSTPGLCVYPCENDSDCANPSGEFCDLSRPDPAGYASGVCRYKSIPTIPTNAADIGE